MFMSISGSKLRRSTLTLYAYELVDGLEPFVLYAVVCGELDPQEPVLGGEHGREVVSAELADEGGVSVGAIADLQPVVLAGWRLLQVERLAEVQLDHVAVGGCRKHTNRTSRFKAIWRCPPVSGHVPTQSTVFA